MIERKLYSILDEEKHVQILAFDRNPVPLSGSDYDNAAI